MSYFNQAIKAPLLIKKCLEIKIKLLAYASEFTVSSATDSSFSCSSAGKSF